ncbi:nitrate reductase molybdenum cofactor assembly chaperone [Spongiactinospora sp. TRM90649]|uniref:nitrate reductase molybdenum cofactor assembly chaperone n=1 Tax=Spongiactinospora sp. TRM90649 TaxID=3031114 RepID=UPI0023F6DEBB|nr:nitrate reductase molybdenum cofactor assembly chaperone [Spongiactinospora sp. TRM90649]MDF5758236.1 nitrate reductase molybdenum cofactor assembly chaperone [Spongiactinospora sp. TRM90649]
MGEHDVRTAHMVASVLLGYPDERLYGARPVLAEAVAGLPAGQVRDRLAAFLRHVEVTGQGELAAHYVATFDLKRRCCLYLTYYAYGDTRKRGGALLRFKHALRAAGFEPADGELPDHLAVVCELSGRGAVREARRLLREHRAGLELLRTALTAERSPYADVVAAVTATLPAAGPREREAALRLAAEGPPAEEVGLEPYAVMEASR